MELGSQEQSSVSGAVGWVALDAILRQGGQFIVTMVLARLIAPEGFGLVAILMTLSGIAIVFVSGGFPSALIQKNSVTDVDASTAFWVNVSAATLLALLFALSAPLIAEFFQDGRLIALTWVMAFNIWLTGFQTVHRALLSREFMFRSQCLATAWATAISGTTAIGAALAGAGVWALLIQTLIATFVSGLLLWRFSRWRPTKAFSLSSFVDLSRFGLYMSAATLVNFFGTRFYTLIIGRFYPAGDLGQFHQAVVTRELPQGLLSAVFSRVVFPMLSSRNRKGGDIVEMMQAALRSGMAINLPIMLGIGAAAPALIPTAFGPQWMPAVPYLQVMCLAGALWPMQSVNVCALSAIGQSKIVFRLEIAKKLILVVSVALASPWGLMAMAGSLVAASLVNFIINSHVTYIYIAYRPRRQIADALPYVCLAVLMTAFVWGLEVVLADIAAPYRLFLEILAGSALYLGIGQAIGLKAFRETQVLIRLALAKHRAGQIESP